MSSGYFRGCSSPRNQPSKLHRRTCGEVPRCRTACTLILSASGCAWEPGQAIKSWACAARCQWACRGPRLSPGDHGYNLSIAGGWFSCLVSPTVSPPLSAPIAYPNPPALRSGGEKQEKSTLDRPCPLDSLEIPSVHFPLFSLSHQIPGKVGGSAQSRSVSNKHPACVCVCVCLFSVSDPAPPLPAVGLPPVAYKQDAAARSLCPRGSGVLGHPVSVPRYLKGGMRAVERAGDPLAQQNCGERIEANDDVACGPSLWSSHKGSESSASASARLPATAQVHAGAS